MRATWSHALEKLEYLDEVLYLLSRLGQPGVRDRVLAQWDEGAKHAGDPVAE